MELLETFVDVPVGYCLCPYPKQWLREYEKVLIRMPEGVTADQITINLVLSIIVSHECVTNWKTGHASVKGCTSYLLGMMDDHFYIEPNPNRVKYEVVSLRGTNFRLYGKIPNLRPKN
jgi:hypothetical protein